MSNLIKHRFYRFPHFPLQMPTIPSNGKGRVEENEENKIMNIVQVNGL